MLYILGKFFKKIFEYIYIGNTGVSDQGVLWSNSTFFFISVTFIYLLKYIMLYILWGVC